jgi:hypothetical protein
MSADLPVLEPFSGAPLTPRALQALRRLVGVLLQEERGEASLSEALVEDLREQCHKVSAQEWVAMVQRQRVVGLLKGHPLVARLLPFLPGALQQQAREERVAALLLARFTADTVGIFERAGLPVLVIKGLPLSLQTTGLISGRGRSGDLDLWVAPRHLADAIRLLEQLGFQREWGEGPLNLEGARWRYCRWTGYEVTLRRQWQTIDLHWALSYAWAEVPDFEEAWHQRDRVDLHGHQIPTLSPCHAFLYACAHAHKDQWRSLRDLLDIERLSRPLGSADLGSLAGYRSVRLSASVTHALTGSDALMACALSPQSARYGVACLQALAAQLRNAPVNLREPDEPWTLGFSLRNGRRMVGLSAAPVDRMRLLLQVVFPPSLFNDPQTGQDRGLGDALLLQLRRLTPLPAPSPPPQR